MFFLEGERSKFRIQHTTVKILIFRIVYPYVFRQETKTNDGLTELYRSIYFWIQMPASGTGHHRFGRALRSAL